MTFMSQLKHLNSNIYDSFRNRNNFSPPPLILFKTYDGLAQIDSHTY